MASARRRSMPAEHDNDERWLLTYADMITLLMALFMVLFSISSVNISKYKTLQQSLKAAFSGSILPGGKAIIQSGSQSTAAHSPATSEIPSIVPLTPNVPAPASSSSPAQSQSLSLAIEVAGNRGAAKSGAVDRRGGGAGAARLPTAPGDG